MSEGELRVYHVPCERLSGLGLAFLPVAQHLRRVINKHPILATYLLVQAYALSGLSIFGLFDFTTFISDSLYVDHPTQS